MQGIGVLVESTRICYDQCVKQKFNEQQALQISIAFMQTELTLGQSQLKEEEEE
jgi:hypothetical protein